MIATVGRVIYKLIIDDWGGIRDMLVGWASKIEALIEHRAEIADAVSKRWNAANDWDRGLYQGEVLGWIMMTVVLVALTLGAGAAPVMAQAGSRFGVLIKALEQLNALGDAITWAKRAVKLPTNVVAAANNALAAPTKPTAVTDVAPAIEHVPHVDADASTARSAGHKSSDADAERATPDVDVNPPTDINHGSGELDSLRVLAGKMSPGDVSEWEPLLRSIANLEDEALRPAITRAQAAQKEIVTLKAQLAAARRGDRFRLETKIDRQVHAAIEDALHSDGVRDALVEHAPLASNTAVHGKAARSADGRVHEPVPGLYDSIDPDFVPHGWRIADNPAQRHPKYPELTQRTTHVWGPDGSYGWIERSYDPSTKTLVMENAFLEKLPRWVDAGIPMVRRKGTNTVTYLTLRQMKLLEVEFGETRLVKMSTIQNIEAVMQLDQLTRSGSGASPLSLQDAVGRTHSVQYATTSIEQSGQVITGIEINTNNAWRWNLTEMMDRFRMAESERQVLFAKYGLGPNDDVLVNYDILIQVSPHPKNASPSPKAGP